MDLLTMGHPNRVWTTTSPAPSAQTIADPERLLKTYKVEEILQPGKRQTLDTWTRRRTVIIPGRAHPAHTPGTR